MAETAIQRPAAVQAGVTVFLRKHEEELRRIHALNVEERAQELSALMNREIDRISRMAPQDPEKELATSILIAWETDRILALDPGRQQKVIAEKYGFDLKALIGHYPELQIQYVELQKKLTAADKNTTFMGWAAFLATATATLVPFGNPKKSIGDRFSSDNKFIKWFFVSLASLAMGFASSIIGSRLFGSKVREESKALVTQSRVALEREIADAIGNKVREGIALAAAPQTVAAPVPDFKAGVERKVPPQPREGFAAETVKEKAAAQAATAIG